jgi:hypothetical protein
MSIYVFKILCMLCKVSPRIQEIAHIFNYFDIATCAVLTVVWSWLNCDIDYIIIVISIFIHCLLPHFVGHGTISNSMLAAQAK